jgi:thiol-disulfide isomerase/thioredoxin
VFLFFAKIGNSQEINKIVVDKKAKKEILIGKCDRKGLKSKAFKKWFKKEYRTYNLDKETLSKINENELSKIEIKVVLATWCCDSRREVPRFYKILDYLKFDENKLSLISIDTSKKAKQEDISNLQIKLVPTFIFYIDENEIGRIIETPEVSLEKDLIEIVENK